MLTRLINVAKSIRLLFLPTTLNMGSVAGFSGLVVVEQIRLTAGVGTDAGVATIVDNTHRVFNSVSDLVAFLNTTFRTAHNLKDSFNVAAGDYICYRNYEGFASGLVAFDLADVLGYYDKRYYSSQYYRTA